MKVNNKCFVALVALLAPWCALATGHTYMGCFIDAEDRALPHSVSAFGNNNSGCSDKCLAEGYSLSGNQFGSFCFCGNNAEHAKHGQGVAISECNMNCPSKEPGGVQSLCGVFNGNAASCSAFCKKEGFDFSGNQYTDECWCGTLAQLNRAQKRPESECSANCSSKEPDGTQKKCGEALRMSVYTRTPATPAPTSPPTKAPTKAPTKSPTKAPTSAPSAAPTKEPTKAPTEAPTASIPASLPASMSGSRGSSGTDGAAGAGGSSSGDKSPTMSPTKSPTNAPTNMSTPFIPVPVVPGGIGGGSSNALGPAPNGSVGAPATPNGSASGDPHFKTWIGKKFDFHGECDLVLLDNPGFQNGLGVRIHIRTKLETWWSYIESAAILIGSLTFELKGGNPQEGPHYWVNGIPGKEDVDSDENLKMLEKILQDHLGVGFKFHYKNVSSKQHKFHIALNNQGDAVSFETYKHWVSVNVKTNHKAGNFVTARGLMGTYPTGARAGRDGSIIIDANSFGKNWQVLADEPMLFYESSNIQSPMECLMPDATSTLKKRRLGESLLSHEDAAVACAHAGDEEVDACIFDVLATNDEDTAGAY